MAISDHFTFALVRLALGEVAELGVLPTLLTQACVDSLAIDGASLSLMNEDVRMPLGADSAMARTAEHLQFTLGEGPCLEAYRTGASGSFSSGDIAARWPIYARRLADETTYQSCATFPLDLGDGVKGAGDLYLTSPDGVASEIMDDAETVAFEVIQALSVDMADSDADRGPHWLRTDSMRDRANLWVAIGLCMPLTALSADEITTLIRGYSFLHGQTIDQITGALVDHTLDPRVIVDGGESRHDTTTTDCPVRRGAAYRVGIRRSRARARIPPFRRVRARCGAQGRPHESVDRKIAHVPLGWRPTILAVRVRRFRCAGCSQAWRQNTDLAAAARSKALAARGAVGASTMPCSLPGASC